MRERKVQLVLGQDDAVGYWVHKQFGADWRPDPGVSFGYVDQTGQLVAGFTFTEYTKNSIWLNVSAVPGCGWWNEQTSWEVYKYVFITCGCKDLRSKIISNNKKSVKICEQFGLTLESTLERYSVDGDLLIYRLKKEDADEKYKNWPELYGVV